MDNGEIRVKMSKKFLPKCDYFDMPVEFVDEYVKGRLDLISIALFMVVCRNDLLPYGGRPTGIQEACKILHLQSAAIDRAIVELKKIDIISEKNGEIAVNIIGRDPWA